MKRLSTVALLCGALIVFNGCDNPLDSDNDSSSTNTETSISGKLVDPYISGAVLCQDSNDNNTCDEGEPTSSTTDSSGSFSFSTSLTSGKNIIIKTQGTHEGKTYDLEISGVVSTDGKIDVVSPITTFQSKGLTESQIAGILNKAASDESLSGFIVSETTILGDPLKNDLLSKKVGDISSDDLLNIQSSLATYGILKIMKGSTTLSALNGTELYTSGTTTGEPVNLIARAMLKGIVNSVNTTTLTTIKTAIDTARSSSGGMLTETNFPEPTVEIIVTVGVAIIDAIAHNGYTTCNATSGTDALKVSTALTAVNTYISNASILSSSKITEIGSKIMGIKFKSAYANIPTFGSIGNGLENIEAGYNSNAKSYRFNNTTGAIEAVN